MSFDKNIIIHHVLPFINWKAERAKRFRELFEILAKAFRACRDNEQMITRHRTRIMDEVLSKFKIPIPTGVPKFFIHFPQTCDYDFQEAQSNAAGALRTVFTMLRESPPNYSLENTSMLNEGLLKKEISDLMRDIILGGSFYIYSPTAPDRTRTIYSCSPKLHKYVYLIARDPGLNSKKRKFTSVEMNRLALESHYIADAEVII